MTRNCDEKATIRIEIALDVYIEELETIVAPGVATSPGPVPGVFLH